MAAKIEGTFGLDDNTFDFLAIAFGRIGGQNIGVKLSEEIENKLKELGYNIIIKDDRPEVLKQLKNIIIYDSWFELFDKLTEEQIDLIITFSFFKNFLPIKLLSKKLFLGRIVHQFC